MQQIVGEVVAAYLGRNDMAADDVPGFIATIHSALSDVDNNLSRRSPKGASGKIAEIVADVEIIDGKLRCRECGKWVGRLGIHIQTQHHMAPHEYRDKWNLTAHYPMDAAKALYRGLSKDVIECLDCHKVFTHLEPHLPVHELTPEQYRQRWGLADDYPMVAPSHS